MISIEKDYSEIPDSLSNESFRNHFDKFKEKQVSVSGKYYAADDVLAKLKVLYNNKCAYCETKEYKPEIEHYRPKSKYPLLAYEWSNLLPACHACNQSKSSHFPTLNKPDYRNIKDAKKLNKSEKPTILNPEIDKPEKHFSFNINTGEIETKNDSEKAIQTIKYCDLNSENLIYRRQKKVKNIKKIINLIHLYTLQGKILPESVIDNLISEIKNGASINSEYSLLGLYLWVNFEKIISPLITDKLQKNEFIKKYKKSSKPQP